MSNDKSNSYWVKVDEDFVRNSDISSQARLLDIILRSYGDTPYIKQSTMAKFLGLSENSTRSVKNYLAELKNHGRLEGWKRRGFHLSNAYTPIKVFDNPTGKYKQVTDDPSYRLLLTHMTGYEKPIISYNQLNYYQLVENFDEDFPITQFDDIAIEVCQILESCCRDNELTKILDNLDNFIIHYDHLDVYKYILKLRNTIEDGEKKGVRVNDPYQLLHDALDYLDKRLYLKTQHDNPAPLKGESINEYESKLLAIRTKGCSTCFRCPLCRINSSTRYSGLLHEEYFGRQGKRIGECIANDSGFAKKLTHEEKYVLLDILSDNFDTYLCVDCILKIYIYT